MTRAGLPRAVLSFATAAYSDSAYERLLQRLDNMKNDDEMSTALLDLDSEGAARL